MGYRNQWTLVAAGPKEDLKEFNNWLKTSVKNKTWTSEEECESAEIILQYKRKSPHGLVYRSIDWIKLPISWDEVVREVLLVGRDQYTLDMAYARFGEELDDSDFDNGKEVYISYQRELLPPNFPTQKK